MQISIRRASLFNYLNKNNVIWMNDPEVTKYLKQRNKFTLLDSIKYYLQNKNESILLAIYHKNNYIGNCGFFNLSEGSAELRISIGEKKLWGKGIGKDVINLMFDHAQQASISKIWLHVSINNERAILLYKNLGFKTTGEIEKIIDDQPQLKMIKII